MGRAVDAWSGEDAEALFELFGEGFGGEAVDGDGEDADAVVDALWSEECESREEGSAGVLVQAVDELGDERLLVLPDVLDAFVEDVFDAFEESGDADGVVRAGLELVGDGLWVCVVFGDASGAALDGGVEEAFEAGPDVERAGAEGSEESLVSREGEEVGVHGVDIDGEVADGLGGVDEERDGHVAADGADAVDGLEGAGDIGGVDGGDEACVGLDGGVDGGGVDEAGVRIGRDACEGDELRELVGEGVDGAEDGVVLHIGDDGVEGARVAALVAGEVGAEEALDGDVEGAGGAVGEDDGVGRGGVDEGCDGGAAFGEECGGAGCFVVGASAGGGADLGVEAGHGLGDGGGFGEAGGGVVEIDAGLRAWWGGWVRGSRLRHIGECRRAGWGGGGIGGGGGGGGGCSGGGGAVGGLRGRRGVIRIAGLRGRAGVGLSVGRVWE